MSGFGRSVAAFVLPLAIGRALEIALGTPWGRNLAEATGNPSLATPEGRSLVRKYSAAAAAVALGVNITFGGRRGPGRDRLKTMGDLSELLLAAGALIKVGVDYVHDRREVESKLHRVA